MGSTISAVFGSLRLQSAGLEHTQHVTVVALEFAYPWIRPPLWGVWWILELPVWTHTCTQWVGSGLYSAFLTPIINYIIIHWKMFTAWKYCRTSTYWNRHGNECLQGYSRPSTNRLGPERRLARIFEFLWMIRNIYVVGWSFGICQLRDKNSSCADLILAKFNNYQSCGIQYTWELFLSDFINCLYTTSTSVSFQFHQEWNENKPQVLHTSLWKAACAVRPLNIYTLCKLHGHVASQHDFPSFL